MKTLDNKSKSEDLRLKAEGVLKDKQNITNSWFLEADILKLIHELQVHQIELEMQNEELLLAKEHAEYASEKYTKLYDFAPNGYFTLTPNAEIIELNLAGASLLSKERLLLQNKHFGSFVSNGSREVFNNFIAKIFESFTTETCEVGLTLNNKISSYIFLTGIAKENENRCFVSAIDITPRKRLETELKKEKEHAEKSDHLKTAFLQNMSHEIRTPMNAIKGFSSLLSTNHYDESKLHRFTKIIDLRCDDLLNIINDILDIAKIESGELPINMEECNLTELFEELTSQFIEYQQRHNKQHIQFILHPLCDLAGSVIITDKVKLKQIFVNLITNSFKFTDKGIVEGGCKLLDHKLMFYVSDTGKGIPADKQDVIFERFAQLDKSKNQTIGGTGLGLPIIKGLVSLLGGEIFLKSEPDKGSTFSFTFPYKLMQALHKESEGIKENEQFCFTNKTILIVEDEIYNIEYIKEILEDTGIHLLFSETGKEAIDIASNQLIDLVLMDIQLPDMNGYEVSKRIRRYKPNIKIISQTAYASDSDKEKAFREGLNDYISKPIKSELLLTMINKHLLNS